MIADRYIKNKANGCVFPYTPVLAARPGFVECGIGGRPLPAPVAVEPVKVFEDPEPTQAAVKPKKSAKQKDG